MEVECASDRTEEVTDASLLRRCTGGKEEEASNVFGVRTLATPHTLLDCFFKGGSSCVDEMVDCRVGDREVDGRGNVEEGRGTEGGEEEPPG